MICGLDELNTFVYAMKTISYMVNVIIFVYLRHALTLIHL